MKKRRVLSMDLETFSDVDLPSYGVYRYVEGDFHILLFAYAFDDEETKCIDLACGEKLPEEVTDAIFNATEGETTEESKSVKTEKLSLKATALPNGLVKSKTCESTDEATYNNWYSSVYMPAVPAANSTGTKSTGTKTTN